MIDNFDNIDTREIRELADQAVSMCPGLGVTGAV